MVGAIALLLILLAVSALISGAEVAFFSLSKKDIENLRAEGTFSGRLIIKLLSRSKRLLATILITNNAANIGIVLLFDSLNLLSDSHDIVWFGFISYHFLLEVGLITLVILTFGEIFPKIYASQHAIAFSRQMSLFVYVLDIICRPLSGLMYKASEYLQKYLGAQRSNISVGHLSQALELTSKEDTSYIEEKMFKGIVSFGDTETKQVMTPRIDILSLTEEMKFQEVIETIVQSSFSRIPIYTETLDNITGILYSKDLLNHIDKKNFDWVKLKRDVYFVPENKKIKDLLEEFRSKKIHMAIVVDEYGGTSGLVTLEDIIEEIVGEINDEFDGNDIPPYRKIDDHNFIFDGKTMLRDFYRITGLSESQEDFFEGKKGESETLAGFILEISGRFPQKGDVIRLENYTFEVLSLSKKRIQQIKVIVAGAG